MTRWTRKDLLGLADLTREGTLQHMRSIEQELFHG